MRAYRIAYDGRPFYGFQRQPSVPTVEGAILDALSALGVLDGGDTPPGYAAAGRTDRGVSALAQTVAFEAPDWLTPRALNGELPADVRAWASAEAPDGFHATADAAWRSYEYHLHAPADEVDDDRAREAVERIEGTHDFRDLSAVGGDDDAVRTVLGTDCTRDGEYLVVSVRAEGFLHEMVRRIATLVDRRARGEAPLPVDRYLEGAGRSGPEGIGPAPAEGLVLTGVGYPDLAFERDPDGVAALRSAFADRRVRARTRTRVLGSVLGGVDRGPD